MKRIVHFTSATRPRYRALAALLGLAVLASISGGARSLRASPGDAEGPHHTDDGRQGSVWVVNRDLGELTVFDARTGKVAARLGVGAGAHDICISEYSRKAYIAAESINTVTAVDLRTLATESIDVGPMPHHLEPSRDGRTIYVTLASHTPTIGAAQYATIDTATNAVEYVTSSANPNARPHAVYPSRDGQTVFAAHDSGNEMTAIDVPTGTIDFQVGSIPRAEEVAQTRAGTFLWVSARGEGTVKRIKIGRNETPRSVGVGLQPESVMLTPSERTLVVSLRGEPAASLAFVDTVNLVLEQKIAIAPAGTLGDLAVMTRDGEYVYATFDYGLGSPTPGGVAVVHIPTRTVVSTFTYPDTGRPHGVWYSSRKAKF